MRRARRKASLFWGIIRVLGHHLDQPVPLDDIISQCHLIHGDPDEYELRRVRRRVQNTISKLKHEGFIIQSIEEEGRQIAYFWPGGRK